MAVRRHTIHSRDLFNFPNLNSEIFYLYLEPHSFQHKHDKPRHPSAFLRLLCTLKCCSILTHPQQIFSSLVTSRFRQRVNKRRWLGSRRTRESSNPFTRIHAVVISAWYFWRTTLAILLIELQIARWPSNYPRLSYLLSSRKRDSGCASVNTAIHPPHPLSPDPVQSSRQIHSIFILRTTLEL